MSTSPTESISHSGEQQNAPKCITCNDLQRVGQTLSLELSQVSGAALGGCQTCFILQESYAYARDVLHEVDQDHDAQVSFQIPGVDEGFPMIVGISDTDGGYSFNEVYTISGTTRAPWMLIGHAPERSRSTREAIPVLKRWIDNCLTTHLACATEQKILPTRVLDVSTNNPSLYVSCGEKKPYTALSHCWGKSPLIQTHRRTLQDRLAGISWNSLSTTFQDAAITTRELGIRYLWIDSLCIVQDDPEDWARESGSMASIYQGAQVVFAASEANDGHQGFLRSRADSAPPKSIFHGNRFNGDAYSIRIRKGDYHRWYGDARPPRNIVQTDP